MLNDNYNKIVTKDINGGPYLRMHLLTSYDILPWDLCRPQAPTVRVASSHIASTATVATAKTPGYYR